MKRFITAALVAAGTSWAIAGPTVLAVFAPGATWS